MEGLCWIVSPCRVSSRAYYSQEPASFIHKYVDYSLLSEKADTREGQESERVGEKGVMGVGQGGWSNDMPSCF